MIPNKVAYVDDKNWMREVKVVAPGIRKMKASNVDYVFPILFSIYITLHIFPFKFSADDMLFFILYI